jgi:hypothetical protein
MPPVPDQDHNVPAEGTIEPADGTMADESVPSVEEDTESRDQSGLSLYEVAKQAAAGEWGQGQERRNRLAAAGYDHNEVHREVVRILNSPVGQNPDEEPSPDNEHPDDPRGLSLHEVSEQVANGDWGEGQERRVRLAKAGYDYNEVQRTVGRLMNPS